MKGSGLVLLRLYRCEVLATKDESLTAFNSTKCAAFVPGSVQDPGCALFEIDMVSVLVKCTA